MIVHICPRDKFMPSYINLINENKCGKEHRFYIENAGQSLYGLIPSENVLFLEDTESVVNMYEDMCSAEKIILHSLWVPMACHFMLRNERLYKKVFWVMWGGDFYETHKMAKNTIQNIQKIENCITYIEGDFSFIKDKFNAKGRMHHCLMYQSNVYTGSGPVKNDSKTVNVQVGNSANPTNNHLEVFLSLQPHIAKCESVYVPLSYGDPAYATQVVEWGESLLGDCFIPLLEFMPLQDYLSVIEKVDIAIFNHERQQAMGNIIQYLGMGKKVCLKKGMTHRNHLESQGIKIYDLSDNDLVEKLDTGTGQKNSKLVLQEYSKETLLDGWEQIFNYDLKAA